jgi:hypothetical protein
MIFNESSIVNDSVKCSVDAAQVQLFSGILIKGKISLVNGSDSLINWLNF